MRRLTLILIPLAAAVSLGLLAWIPPAAAPGHPLDEAIHALDSLLPAASVHQRIAAEIGLDKARVRYGRLPTGQGIVAGHVEGDPGRYTPSPGGFGAVRFIHDTGPSRPLAHTNITTRLIYGPDGLAPGIRTVYSFDAGDWMGHAYLHTDTGQPPDPHSNIRIFNDSWIGRATPVDLEILHRVDYQIDKKHVLMCVAVNNHRSSKVPALLASAYNVIAVGVASGNSSGGYTRIDTPGRCKPDIVAPETVTSFATPIVTACAARLLEAGDRIAASSSTSSSTSAQNRARRAAAYPQVIKAVLMAGAIKSPKWHREKGKPLAEHLGAGEVNFFNSYTILKQGPEKPGRLHRRYGWDFRALSAGQTAAYRFTAAQPLGRVTIMLVWDRHILGKTAANPFTGDPLWLDLPSLAHFYLRLQRINDDGSTATVATSASNIDNVQLVFRKSLPAGRYRIQVLRQRDHLGPWTYALAWRIDRPKQAPKPSR